jgi:hypothetical protein
LSGICSINSVGDRAASIGGRAGAAAGSPGQWNRCLGPASQQLAGIVAHFRFSKYNSTTALGDATCDSQHWTLDRTKDFEMHRCGRLSTFVGERHRHVKHRSHDSALNDT